MLSIIIIITKSKDKTNWYEASFVIYSTDISNIMILHVSTGNNKLGKQNTARFLAHIIPGLISQSIVQNHWRFFPNFSLKTD